MRQGQVGEYRRGGGHRRASAWQAVKLPCPLEPSGAAGRLATQAGEAGGTLEFREPAEIEAPF